MRPRSRLSPCTGRLIGGACLIGLIFGCGESGAPTTATVGVAAPQSPTTAPPRPAPGPRRGISAWHFTEVSRDAGFNYTQQYLPTAQTARIMFGAYLLDAAGGVASGDFDHDGLVDLYVVHGDIGPNYLFKNVGNGTFIDVADRAGVAFSGTHGAGPAFADVNGDGWLDLLIGGIEDTTVRLMLNHGDGTFSDATMGSGLEGTRIVLSAAFGDYDRDGDLDLALARWGGGADLEHLWSNDGSGHFTAVGKSLGLGGFGTAHTGPSDFSFTPNFVDVDDDGWPDLLFSADYRTTQYFLNQAGKSFTTMRPAFLHDRNGMGSAIGDFDNDGRLDWFVTGINNPNVQIPPQIGNRLYHNLGAGQFEDVTDRAGVALGYWGWGVCFADFNNDGLLDVFHVNGFRGSPGSEESQFVKDPSRLFVGAGDGTFVERSADVGVDDLGQGRGIVCFDYDGDGDIDIFVANNGEPPLLYRNDLGPENHYVDFRLHGKAPNTEATGALVYVTSGGTTQMRLIRAGSNFESEDPAIAHFGLGGTGAIDKVRVVWPDRMEMMVPGVQPDRLNVIEQP